MNKPPVWFTVIVVVALLWNVAGLLAVFADLRLTAADIAGMPAQQQELYKTRPLWSVVASVVAVLGGTLGCLGLLLRKQWALALLYASLVGVVVQDVGLFVVAGAAKVHDPVPFVLQGLVLVVAVSLIALGRLGVRRSFLA